MPEPAPEPGSPPALSDDRLALAARRLCEVRSRREPFGGFPADQTPPDEATAYRLQDLLHACLSATGWGPLVGYKIGCTTPVMQAYLGIPNPCAGACSLPLSSMARASSSTPASCALGWSAR